MDKYEELVAKYKERLKEGLVQHPEKTEIKPITSREYEEFKAAYMPKHMSVYEKLCNFSERFLKLRPDKKREAEILESINICHLNITPSGAVSFAYFFPILFILVGSFLSFVVPFVLGFEPSLFFLFFFLAVGAVLIVPFNRLPDFMANNWRMKASNQMVLCIFYVVTYMRHTSNLERAIEFASEHIAPPLSLDLKKVLWDVETEKYESIKESLDIYLETWKKWNMEFIESFHLVESSLYEADETRRLETLDKALSTILEETYEKMLHYAQNLKSPLTMVHMLGIILPILGLVILPLVVSFMESVKWYHLAVLYNVILPIGVFYLIRNILSKRPTGYGESDLTEINPELKKYKKVAIKFAGGELRINPIFISLFIAMILFIIGIMPILLHIIANDDKWDIVLMGTREGTSKITIVNKYSDPELMKNIKFRFLEYRESRKIAGRIIGPYGLGASIMSLFITLSVGLGIGLFYKMKSKDVVKIRNAAKELEKEFASALFQLGNRLADGLPAEIAFGKVSEVMEGTTSGTFFKAVETNIRRLGMSVEQAIFDPRAGAILKFPSKVIESSMKVLVESSKKGPRTAAQALINVSIYIKEIHKVDERLKDLMADVISDIKSQINFLTPTISGIVIGITSLITTIIGKLGEQLQTIQKGAAAPTGAGAGLIELFGDGIPTYYFQLIVGFYVVQIIYILSTMSNGIENGVDKIQEDYLIGQNVTRGTLIYVLLSFIVIVLFNFVAATILRGGVG